MSEPAALAPPAPSAQGDDETVVLLRESARSFATRELAPARLRRLRDALPHFARDTWSALAALGWTGLLVPEACGGSGLGLAEMVVVLEELGRPLLPEPLVPCAVLAATALRHGDNPALQQRLLGALAAGDGLPALAWQERPQFSTAADALQTQAQRQGDGWVLNGGKRFVRPGVAADGLLVAARADEGLGLFWVEAGSAGLRIEIERCTDGGASARVALDAVAVPDAQVLATPGVGQQALDNAIDAALVATGAELLGLMRGALSLALEHLRTRRQFGKPIGSFQALQHRAVDLLLQQELSAALVAEAAAHFDALPPGPARSALASRVKVRTSEGALAVAKEAVHVHGALGYTDECDIGLYLKRALSLAGWLGTATEHRERYAALAGAAARAEGAPA